MKQFKCTFTIILLFGFLIVSSCKVTNSNKNSHSYKTKALWTEQDAYDYAREREDSTKWNYTMLKNDLKFQKRRDSLKTKTDIPITFYPSPIPDYSDNGSTVMPYNLKIDGVSVRGYSLSHKKDKYKKYLFNDDENESIIFFNILYTSDLPEYDMEDAWVLSRNYPHYLFTGTQKTSLGKIDWEQMTLANNENYAIIAQRFFDLKYGITILIAPQKDGSLRMLQIEDSIASFTFDDTRDNDKYKETSYYKFAQEWMANEKIKKFFTNKNNLEAVPFQRN